MSTADNFGVYTDNQGDNYFINPDQSITYLDYYDAATGEYTPQGDTVVYDANGYDTGKTVANTAANNLVAQQKTTWLDVLNTGLGAAGNIFGNKNTPAQTNVYTPAPAATKPAGSGKTWLIIGLLVVAAGTAIVIVKTSKKAK